MFHHELIFVGDVHGQYAKLEQLLAHIKTQGNADVPLVFLGDLIDNKPSVATQHLKVLRRVKGLVEQGKAYCVMGNHELNAIGFATYRQDNEKPLRPHTPNNIRQHEAFLSEVGINWTACSGKLAFFNPILKHLEISIDDLKQSDPHLRITEFPDLTHNAAASPVTFGLLSYITPIIPIGVVIFFIFNPVGCCHSDKVHPIGSF